MPLLEPRPRKWPALRLIPLPPPEIRLVPPLSPDEVIPRWGCKRRQCRVLLLPEDALPQPPPQPPSQSQPQPQPQQKKMPQPQPQQKQKPQPQQKKKKNDTHKNDEKEAKKGKTSKSKCSDKDAAYIAKRREGLKNTIENFKPLVSRERFEEDYRRVFGEEPPPRPQPKRLTKEEAEHKERMERLIPGYKYIKAQLLNRERSLDW